MVYLKSDAQKMMARADVKGLIKALKYGNYDIRKIAAEALGSIEDTRVVEPLIEAQKDENRDVRGGAVGALGKTGGERMVEPLTQA